MLSDSGRRKQSGLLNLAEDSLKALVVGHQDMETHDLGRIMNHLRDNNVLNNNDLSNLSSHAAVVTGSATYNDMRYPDNDPNYSVSQPREVVGNAVARTEYFYNFVRAKIASINTSSS